MVTAGRLLGMDIEWRGQGAEEVGVDPQQRTGARARGPALLPAHRGGRLCSGDASKIRDKLGWQPEVTFDALVREMIEADLALAKRDALVAKEGYRVYQRHE